MNSSLLSVFLTDRRTEDTKYDVQRKRVSVFHIIELQKYFSPIRTATETGGNHSMKVQVQAAGATVELVTAC
jgi:hypothetical protein